MSLDYRFTFALQIVEHFKYSIMAWKCAFVNAPGELEAPKYCVWTLGIVDVDVTVDRAIDEHVF